MEVLRFRENEEKKKREKKKRIVGEEREESGHSKVVGPTLLSPFLIEKLIDFTDVT